MKMRKKRWPNLKTIELYRELGKLVKAGHGDRIIQVMDVLDGMTWADDIVDAIASQAYDGDKVWILLGETHSPEWSK